MKKMIFPVLLFFLPVFSPAQTAQDLINQSINLIDEEKYAEAILKLDEALKLEPSNAKAQSVKASALYFSGKFEQAADLCKQFISENKNSAELKNVYVTYGNSLNELGKPKDALKIYKEGMKKCPDSYLLPYDAGLTYLDLKMLEDAAEMFELVIRMNPEYAGSHYYLGKTMDAMGKKIPATLAFMRFLLLEHEGGRANFALPYVLKKIKGNAAKNENGQIYVTVDPDIMDKDKENNFAKAELTLAGSAAYDFADVNKGKSETELFIQKMDTLITAMEQYQGEEKGFFWTYYVPFFIELKKQAHLDTFCYILYGYRETADEEVDKWMAANNNRLQSFVLWVSAYTWPKEEKK